MLTQASCRLPLLTALLVLSLALLPARSAAQDQARPPAAKESPKRYRYWKTSWSFPSIDLRDLTGRLARIGIVLPIEMSGTAAVNFDVSVPLNGLRHAKAYRFRGSFRSPRMKADQLELFDVEAIVNYTEGSLNLSRLSGRTKAGKFEGDARADVLSSGPFDASLHVNDVAVGPIAKLMTKFGLPSTDAEVNGSLDADIELSGRLDRRNDIRSWRADGRGQLSELTIGQSVPYTMTVEAVKLNEGRLSLSGVGVRSSQRPGFFLSADAQAQLGNAEQLKVEFQANDLVVGDWLEMYFHSDVPAHAKLDLRGTVSGVASGENGAPELSCDFAIASPSIQLFGLDLGLLEHRLKISGGVLSLRTLEPHSHDPEIVIESLDAAYAIEPDAFRVSDFEGHVFGGRIRGSAELTRRDDGNHTVDLAWKEIAPRFRQAADKGTRAFNLSGHSSGSVHWIAPAETIGQIGTYRGQLNIQIDPLVLQGRRLGSADIEIDLHQRDSTLRGSGQLLEGSWQLGSQLLLNKDTTWRQLPEVLADTRLTWRDISLASTAAAFLESSDINVNGKFSGTSQLSWRPTTATQSGGWNSQCEGDLRGVRVRGTPFASRVDFDFVTQGSELEIRSLQGSVAGGALRAKGRWSLANGPRELSVALSRANADRILVPLSDAAKDWAKGQVSGRATVIGVGTRAADGIRISGAMQLAGGRVFGAPVGNARTPIRVHWRARPHAWRAEFPHVTSDLADGRLNGELYTSSTTASSRGFNLDSQWRINHVEFEQLLHQVAGTNTVGRGNVSGRLTLNGRNIRSLRDLRGSFRARLGSTDVSAVPGIAATGSLLGVGALVDTKFTDGNLSGKIFRGSVAVEQLVLLSNRLKVVTSGRIGLQDSRLDMMTVATTGNFRGQTQLLEGISPNALETIQPIASVNRLVTDRTVVVDMVGTVQRPVLRLRPAETVQANARQFILRQLSGQLYLEAALLQN